jgi:hypothetical protein
MREWEEGENVGRLRQGGWEEERLGGGMVGVGVGAGIKKLCVGHKVDL